MAYRIPRSRTQLDVVLPDPDQFLRKEGQRLHIRRDTELNGCVYISEEQTLPEKILDVKANHVNVLDELCLDEAQCRWLRDQLTRALMSFAEDAEEAA